MQVNHITALTIKDKIVKSTSSSSSSSVDLAEAMLLLSLWSALFGGSAASSDSMESEFVECCTNAVTGVDFFLRSSSRSQLGTGGWYIIEHKNQLELNGYDD